MADQAFADLHIEIDETQNPSQPSVNLFDLDMKYQSHDFSAEISSDVVKESGSETVVAGDEQPPFNLFDMKFKYQSDDFQLEEEENSPIPSTTTIDFSKGDNSILENTKVILQPSDEEKKEDVEVTDGEIDNSLNRPKNENVSTDGGQSNKLLEDPETTQNPGLPAVEVHENQTHLDEESTVNLEDILMRSKSKSRGDSDDEFEFDVPHKGQESTKNAEFTPMTINNAPDQSSVKDNIDQPKSSAVVIKQNKIVEGPTDTLQKQDLSINQTTQSVISTGETVLKQIGGISDFIRDERQKTDAHDEWENVQTIEAEFVDENDTKKKESAVSNVPMLSYFEMSDYFSSKDFSSVKSQIRTTVDRHGFSALKHFLFGPPKLHRDLLDEKEKVFCVAASTLDNSDEVHVRSLQTIYRTLTGSRFDCARFGSHWEEIGFQGRDPSTDLRGVGMLGLLNLIYLLRDPKRQVLAHEIYKLSLHPTQNFPFCVMGMNISRITLQALREDCLNKECNKRRDVTSVVNDFYSGLYLQMYQIWKSQGKTIVDSGYVIQNIEQNGKKHPQNVFKNLEEYIAKKNTAKNLDGVILDDEQFHSVVEKETAGHY